MIFNVIYIYFSMSDSQTERDSLVAAFQSNMVDETVKLINLVNCISSKKLHIKSVYLVIVYVFSIT